MSYFDKTNTTVTRRSYGTSFGREITNKDLIPVKDRGNRKALTESANFELKQDLEKKVNDTRLGNYRDEQARRQFLNEGFKALKEDLIKDIMREICVESLVIDEEPVMENLKNIFELVDEQVESIGGFEGVKKTGIKLNNPVLNEMVEICESMAKEVADRVLKEELDCFKMNDCEIEKFDYNKKQMGVDTIVDIVKDKVFKVVKDEQKASQEKEEMMNEIKDKLEDVEAPVEEAMEFIFGQDKVEEVSLFSSMMRKDYKTILESSAATIFESKCAKDAVKEEDEIDINDIDVHEDEDYLDKNIMKASDVRLTDVDSEIEDKIDDDDNPDKINNLIDENDDDDEVEELMLKEGRIADITDDVLYKYLDIINKTLGKGAYDLIVRNPDRAKIEMGRLKSHVKFLEKIKDKRSKGDYCYDETNVKSITYNQMSTRRLNMAIKVHNDCIDIIEKRLKKLEAKEARKAAKKAVKEAAIAPMYNKFTQLGESIMEAYLNDEVETYDHLLNEMADAIEAYAPGCKDVTKAKACKEFVRNLEVSTEGLCRKKKATTEAKCGTKTAEGKCGKDGEVVMELDSEKKPQDDKPTEADKSNNTEPTTEGFVENIREKMKNFFEKDLSRQIVKRDFGKVRSNLTMFVKNMNTAEEIELLEKDLEQGKEQLKKAIVHYPDAAEKIKEHLKWMDTDYAKMLEKRKKEIAANKVTESFSARLDVVCDKLDEMIEKHEDALYEANMSMESEYEGRTIVLPLIESIDYNLSNIKFVYKVKTVCESLNDMIDNIENEIDAVQLQEMIQLNIASIDSTNSMLQGNDEVSDYKLGLLEHARTQLSIMDGRIDRIRDGLDDRADYQSINEAKAIIDELYDSKRNRTLIEQMNGERMELVMAEAITNYTILEAFNTLNLLKFDKETVRQMARNNIR